MYFNTIPSHMYTEDIQACKCHNRDSQFWHNQNPTGIVGLKVRRIQSPPTKKFERNTRITGCIHCIHWLYILRYISMEFLCSWTLSPGTCEPCLSTTTFTDFVYMVYEEKNLPLCTFDLFNPNLQCKINPTFKPSNVQFESQNDTLSLHQNCAQEVMKVGHVIAWRLQLQRSKSRRNVFPSCPQTILLNKLVV